MEILSAGESSFFWEKSNGTIKVCGNDQFGIFGAGLAAHTNYTFFKDHFSFTMMGTIDGKEWIKDNDPQKLNFASVNIKPSTKNNGKRRYYNRIPKLLKSINKALKSKYPKYNKNETVSKEKEPMLVKDLSVSESHALFISEDDDKIYGTGSNIHFQHGFDKNKTFYNFQELEDCTSKNIKNYTIISNNIENGTEINEHPYLYEIRMKKDFGIKDKIEKVFAFGNSSFFLSKNQKLYACGNNEHNKLGIHLSTKTITKKRKKKGIKIVEPFGIKINEPRIIDKNEFYFLNNKILERKQYFELLPKDEKYLLENRIPLQCFEENGNEYYVLKNGMKVRKLALLRDMSSNPILKSFSGKSIPKPMKVELKLSEDETIVQIEGIERPSLIEGDEIANTIILTNKGNVYVCGKFWNEKYTKFTKISSFGDCKITKIVSGKGFYHFLTQKGDVYSIGDNSFGELGLGDDKDRELITKNENLKNVRNISCGDNHSFFKGKDFLLACGSNFIGQLSRSLFVKDDLQKNAVLTPKEINIVHNKNGSKSLTRFVDAYCCSKSTYLLDESKEFWVVGNGSLDPVKVYSL